MTRRDRLLSVLLCCAAWWLGLPRVHAERVASQQLAEIQRAIDSLDLIGAERLIAGIEDPALRPAQLYFQGVVELHHGDYASAQGHIDAALHDAPPQARPPSWVQTQTMVRAVHRLVGAMQTQSSGNGRYRVYFGPEDAVLASEALRVLEAADRALTNALGIAVPGPLRLEVYPSAASLAQVSPLTEAQIETSGTIALCKWNRLMITTPRALVRGYAWADTIAHELTHLFVSFKTRERAPVWLQEGTAKLLERAWRAHADASFHFEPSDGELRLDAASESLLMNAAKTNKLLPFERLHPSIALLPSQEDAALAFAQVSTFMQRFVGAYGVQGLRDAFTRVGNGEQAPNALAQVATIPFATLERQWSSALREREAKAPGARALARRFVRGKAAPDELSEVEQEAARRFLRLGDMLWSRGHHRAASVEYGKAHTVDPRDPIVTSRYGRAALLGGDAATAQSAMQSLLASYPEHEPALSVLANAALSLGDTRAAQRAAYEAILINPFDPDPHCVLAKTLPSGARETEQQRCISLR